MLKNVPEPSFEIQSQTEMDTHSTVEEVKKTVDRFSDVVRNERI